MRLVVCGSIAIDSMMDFGGRFQEAIDVNKLEVLSMSLLVDRLERAEGGTGANIAYNLAALGDQPVLLGSVGSDAQAYLKRLASAGVDTSAVHISHLPTATFQVISDREGNQIGGFYPGAMADAAALNFQHWPGESHLFCISAHDPVAMRRQTEECQQNKLRLVYDPGQQVNNVEADDLRSGLAAAEVLILNEYEASIFSKKTGLSLEAITAKVPVLVVTHGAKGSTISGQKIGQTVKVDSAKPAQIIDPTGAGDAYRAGFLYGYLRQWEERKCGQLGAVIASFILEQAGPHGHLDHLQIAQRYQATFNEELTL